MRIALLSSQWPAVRMGGIGAYTHLVARRLAVVGHDVHVFTFTLPDDARAALRAAAVANLTVHDIPDLAARLADAPFPATPQSASRSALAAASFVGGTGMAALAGAWLLCQAVRVEHRRQRFDIVEAAEYEALGLPLIIAPEPGLAVVTHLHSGSAINRLGNQVDARPADRVIDALEAAAILGATGVCAPSQRVVKVTHETLDIPIDATVIPLPVDLPSYTGAMPAGAMLSGARGPAEHAGSSEVSPTLAIAEITNSQTLLFVGRLERLKGAEILAHALPSFLTATSRVQVRLVGPDTPTAPDGSGSMRHWFLAQIPASLRDRIVFTGELPPPAVYDEIRRARLLVIPSLFESFSLIAAEGLALGCPIVVGSETGAAELVGSGGVVFPRGDAPALAELLIDLWADVARLKQLAGAGRQRAADYLDPERTLAARLDFYTRMAGRAQVAPPPLAQRLSWLPEALSTSLLPVLARTIGYLAGGGTFEMDPEGEPTPGMRLTKILLEHRSTVGWRVRDFWLYGAGRHTARLLAERHLWESEGFACAGLIDDHPRFATPGAAAWGLPVHARDAFAELVLGGAASMDAHPWPPVILSTDTHNRQFWDQTFDLRQRGLRIFDLYDPHA